VGVGSSSRIRARLLSEGTSQRDALSLPPPDKSPSDAVSQRQRPGAKTSRSARQPPVDRALRSPRQRGAPPELDTPALTSRGVPIHGLREIDNAFVSPQRSGHRLRRKNQARCSFSSVVCCAIGSNQAPVSTRSNGCEATRREAPRVSRSLTPESTWLVSGGPMASGSNHKKKGFIDGWSRSDWSSAGDSNTGAQVRQYQEVAQERRRRQ